MAHLVTSFTALARFDCLTKTKIKDLTFVTGGATIKFWDTKTDTFNQGQTVFVKAITGSVYCPVTFLHGYFRRLQWEAFLGGFFPYNGPLFPALTGAQIALVASPRPFSKQGALLAMKNHLFHLGVPNWDKFTLHSGRRGRASAAVAAGCDMLTLKRQGRWKSDSCPQLYVDEHVSLNTDFTKFLEF